MRFNPLDPAFLNDPYPFFRALRETAPIHYEETIGGWMFTRYDDVSALLREPRLIRPPVADTMFASVPQAARDELSVFGQMLGKALPFTNPPDHTRLRVLFRKAFTPRAVEAMRPSVQRTTDGLLDAIEAKGGADIMAELAYPLPSTVVLDFVGVPAADQPRLMGWAAQMMALLGSQYATDAEALARTANAAMGEFVGYMTDLIGQRRESPRGDMLSTLAGASAAEAGITDEELILNVIALINAAADTTANYIGNGTLALLRHPDQFRLLREDPSVAETAAEELLRYDGPTPINMPQLASEDLEIGGQSFKKGQLLYPVIGAANRDPARFPDPERLDLTRPPGGQLSFGSGIHFCIGAALARLEGQVLFASLAARFPHLRLDPDAPPPAFREDPLLRGLVSLHVRTDPG